MTPLAVALALSAAQPPARPVVSVLYFENRTNDPALDVLRKGMAEMILTDLVAWDGVTVVERQRLDDVLKELELQRSKAFDATTAVKVGKLVGAQYAITGSMFLQGDQLRIDAAVTHIERGDTVATASATEAKDRVFDLEQQLVDKLVTAIDVKLKGSSARQRAKVPDFDALLAYSKAVDLSDQGKHDEAQKAMAALVSKSPTFVMAREKKQALLKKLKEYEAQKKDLISAAVLEVGKRAEQELGKPFAAKGAEAKKVHVLWRMLQGRYLMRLLKPSLSFRAGSLRVVKVGQEPKALALLQKWVENQRSLIDESVQLLKLDRYPSVDPSKKGLYELLRDSGLADADSSVSFNNVGLMRRELLELVVQGRANDGDRFEVAPPLGALDTKALERVFDEDLKELLRIEAAWRKAGSAERANLENDLTQGLLFRGEQLGFLRRDDEAAQAYQKVLDLLPTHDMAKRAEKEIQKIIGAVHDSDRKDRERSESALKGQCHDFYLPREVSYRLRRKGLAGVDELVQQVEGACLGRYSAESPLSRFYKSAASTFAQHEDCDRAKRLYLKSFAFGGDGPRSFEHLKKNEPWCSYGLDEGNFPTKLRLYSGLRDRNARDRSLNDLDKALVELLADELLARGIAVDRGGSSGNNESARVEVAWAGPELELFILKSVSQTTGKTTKSWFEDVSRVASNEGRLDLDALLGPYLSQLTRGSETWPFPPSETLTVASLVDYAAALELYERRKWDEAKTAFDALAAKDPSLRGAKVRSTMAQEQLARAK